MPSNITPRVASELNVQLYACFDEGVKDGINEVFAGMEAGQTTVNILEALRFVTNGTAEGVFTYAPTDYTQYDDALGDETPIEGTKMYESRIKSGRKKKREIQVDLVDWSDDLVGQYKTQFHTLGTTSVVAPYRRIVDTMAGAGSIITTIDDVAFYSTAHPQRPKELGGTPWPNDFIRPAGATFPVLAEMWARMVTYPGEDGKPCGSRPTILAVAPEDLGNAYDFCFNKSPSALQGGGNPYFGQLVPAIVPEWTGLGMFQMFDTRNSLERGFIMLEREANRLVPIYTNPNDPWVVDNGMLKWRLEGRYNVGTGHPRRALRCRKS